jgi:hypothetical protein
VCGWVLAGFENFVSGMSCFIKWLIVHFIEFHDPSFGW